MMHSLLFLCGLGLVVSTQGYDPSIDLPLALVVMGDSLVDNHNFFRLTKGQWPPRKFYRNGRGTNGPTFAEHGAKALKLEMHNLACYGSTINNYTREERDRVGIEGISRSFFEQIDLYRKQRASFKETWSNSPFLSLSQRYHPTVVSHPPPTPAESIFLISYGGNDYAFPILATPPGKLPSRNRIPKAAVVVEAMETNLRILIKEGATKIVLTTLLPPTISPQMRNNGRVLKIWSQKLFVEHNERLRNMTEKLMAENNKLKIVIFDLYSIMLDIAAEPDKHGLEEVISPCVEFDPTTKLFRRVCENQGWNSKRRLYWDHIHPTTDAHAILSTFLEPLIRETFLETPESQFGHLDFDEVLKYPLQPFGSPPRRLKESPQTPRHIGPYQTSAALPHFASRKYGLRAKRPTQIRSTPPAHSSAKRGVGGSVRFSG